MIVPIRTETEIRTVPWMNFILVGTNVIIFILMNARADSSPARLHDQGFIFDPLAPTLLQFFSYQFLHEDIRHLLGNMLFLWVFGNAVNVKLGQFAFLMFYLSGGVFAAFAHASVNPNAMLGASGAIAAVTGAYLVLFPRSRVLVLFFITLLEVPAILIIGLKIILWDNIVSPMIHGPSDVAIIAHLAGYLLGFVVTFLLLMVRGVPRDQFDSLALLDRWKRRREAAVVGRQIMSGPVFRRVRDAKSLAAEESRLDQVSDLRGHIGERLAAGDWAEASRLYQQLMTLDPEVVLSEQDQMRLAKSFFSNGLFPQAAAAFERYVQYYSRSPEADATRLLLGIIYARDLQQPQAAEGYLTEALTRLTDNQLREQCRMWLTRVRSALGKAPDEE